jgi:hypothetical protein
MKIKASYTAIISLVSLGLFFNLSFASALCSDSDGGKNYYLKGYSTGSANQKDDFSQGALSAQVYDICSGNTLTEYYCDSEGYVSRQNHNCQTGCLGGACLSNPAFNISNLLADISTFFSGFFGNVKNLFSI